MQPPHRLLFFVTVGFALVFAVTSFLPSAESGTSGPLIGVNCSKNIWTDPESCRLSGTKIGRVEWDISTTPTNMDALMGAFAGKGIKVQPLAGFYGRLPTVQEAQNLRNWALRFGPGGTFWQGRSDGHLAISNVEFGNETSFSYQFGESGTWWLSQSYSTRARNYALRVKDASVALQGTGVGLLVQADDAGSGASSWVDNMAAAVPNLGDYVAGWTIHPYGPNGFARIDRMLSFLGAAGMPSSIPFYITEWGLSSDNGRTLTDNYGYPRDMTYAQAATTLRDVVARWKSSYGSRFAQAIIYQNADLGNTGASTDREMYFGILKKDGSEKGAYTTEVRAQISGSGISGTVNQQPVASATATPTSGNIPLTVSFNGSGSTDPDGSVAAWAWDLDGDGQFDDSVAANPSYGYTSAGTYTVKLRVTDNQGTQDVSDPLTITAGAVTTNGEEKAAGRPATASSSENAPWFTPQHGNDGTLNSRWSSLFLDNQWWQVDLGSSRTVNSVQVTFNAWAWPKSYTVSTSSDGSSWTAVANETMSAAGTKTSAFPVRSARYVRITGITRGTSNGTSIEEAKVYGPTENTTPANTPPIASATATPTSGTIPLNVSFNGSGSKDPDGSVAAWAWDLDGDGQFDDSSGQSPSYQYTTAGTYAVKLRVTDNQGAQDVSDPLTVTASASTTPVPPPGNSPPVASATATPTSGTVPLTVSFNGSGSKDPDGSVAAWAWDLDGDGQFDDSSGQSPSYQYTTAGTYVVKLRVTDNQGAQDVSDALTITAAPVPAQPPPAELFDVFLVEVGVKEAHVIQAIRAATNLSQLDAKELVNQAPVIVVKDLTRDAAEKLKAELIEAGARAELR